MKVRIYKYKTHGIYEWGRGFINGEVADKWYKFWKYVATNGQIPNTNRIVGYWNVLPGDVGCDILVSTGGSIYLHPMNGDGVIQVINEAKTDAVYAELCRLMNDCAEYIGDGASVEMYTSKIRTIRE